MTYKPVILIILDGFGIWREQKGNPIYLASTPNLNKLTRLYPGAALSASGIEVGLPWGEVGNSEVGHTNIGAGLVVYQSFPRIQFAIKDGSFFQLKVWDEMIDHSVRNNSAIHLMGLVSNGGIHSHIEHLFALLEVFKKRKAARPVFIHMFTDGQDAPPQSAGLFLTTLEKKIKELKIGQIATIMGRHYAMDKNHNLELTGAAFECLTQGRGKFIRKPKEALTGPDEFIPPSVIADKNKQPIGSIKNGDALFFFNFRADRARQLTEMFLKPELFSKRGPQNLFFAAMTQYSEEYFIKTAFPPQPITQPLAKIVADAGKKQLHLAETEKYAHITYFLNGGREEPYAGEDRLIVPTVKVESYDLQPEMSAYEITDKILEAVQNGKHDFIAINFANADLVAHTGNLEASAHAVSILDECIGKIISAVLKKNGAAVITADHGNAEEMINLTTGDANTEHSTNPVPCWIITADNQIKTPDDLEPQEIAASGILADVAPTILELMNIPKPKEMTGRSLAHEATALVLK